MLSIMKTISNSEVNDKFVLLLTENTEGLLGVREHPIKNADQILSIIESVVEDPQKTLYDLYSILYYYFDSKVVNNFCYPYEYDNAFVEPANCPPKVERYSYNELINSKYMEIVNSNRYKRMDDIKKQVYINETISALKNKIASRERKLKNDYAQIAIRHIKCINLNRALEEVERDRSVRMFSSDSIGWTTFVYAVSRDVHVSVKTNFGYGSSAYFCLAVKYKDLVLIPYSFLVHYYYANMKNLISYTRSYSCRRDSWRFALNFVADFVNESKNEPEKFVRDKILSEVFEMIKGLRATIDNPEEIMMKIKNVQEEYISIKVIRPFMNEDQKIYESMPTELVSVFKAEKVSGALLFLDSLKLVIDLCPEVKSIIDEVVEMNNSIISEVENVLNSINKDLRPLEIKQDKNIAKLETLEKQIEVHEKRINQLIEKNPLSDKDRIKEDYIKKNSIYKQKIEKRKDLFLEISKLGKLIKRRKRLRKRMTACLERIHKYIQT